MKGFQIKEEILIIKSFGFIDRYKYISNPR